MDEQNVEVRWENVSETRRDRAVMVQSNFMQSRETEATYTQSFQQRKVFVAQCCIMLEACFFSSIFLFMLVPNYTDSEELEENCQNTKTPNTTCEIVILLICICAFSLLGYFLNISKFPHLGERERRVRFI